MISGLTRRTTGAALVIRPALLACATAALAVASLAAPASADAASLSPSGCTSNYVVGSAPLKNLDTGVASWNYGYVQLWYSNGCQENWSRVVFLLSGATTIRADVYNDDPNPGDITHECGSNAPTEDGCAVTGTPVESPGLYSPVYKDEALGLVGTESGVSYSARWAQPHF